MSDNVMKLVQTTIFSLSVGATILGSVWLYRQPVINPVDPVDPKPPASTLGDLIPNEQDRANLAGFYSDYSTAVNHPALRTTGQFRMSQQISAKILQDTIEMGSLSAVNDPISKRLVDSIGLDDRELDAATRANLSTTLKEISNDLK